MARKCFKCSGYLPSSNVDPHLSCLSCREVFCSLASRCDSCRNLSHDQFQRLLVGIKDRMERKMASASSATGKRKSSSSSQQLDKLMCRMEETLEKLSQVLLYSSSGSSFSGFVSPASQMDSSQPGPSGTQGKTVYGGEVGVSHQAPMPGGHLTTQDTEVGICHTAPMLGGQTPIRDTVDGVCHGSHAWRPSTYPQTWIEFR